MDLESLKPLAQALATNGAPFLAKVLLVALPPPFNLVANTILNGVAAAFGTPPGDPGAAAAAINADPAAADKLSAIEDEYKSKLDFANLQVQLDEKEAESTNLFISGWRPAFAWSCILFTWYQVVETAWGLKHVIPPDMFNPIWVAFGGLLGLRTVDKILGVASDNKVVSNPVKKLASKVFGKKKR